jgi:hypothetical protein
VHSGYVLQEWHHTGRRILIVREMVGVPHDISDDSDN